MLRHHLQRCVDADILASVCVCRNLSASAAVQRHASADVHGWSISSLTSSNVSNVLCFVRLSRTKKLQCERNEWCYKLGGLQACRIVCWFQNRNWKSAFIKHAHYAQLTTLEGHVGVWPSVFAATHKFAAASICRCAKCLQMRLHLPPPISGHSSLPMVICL